MRTLCAWQRSILCSTPSALTLTADAACAPRGPRRAAHDRGRGPGGVRDELAAPRDSRAHLRPVGPCLFALLWSFFFLSFFLSFFFFVYFIFFFVRVCLAHLARSLSHFGRGFVLTLAVLTWRAAAARRDARASSTWTSLSSTAWSMSSTTRTCRRRPQMPLSHPSLPPPLLPRQAHPRHPRGRLPHRPGLPTHHRTHRLLHNPRQSLCPPSYRRRSTKRPNLILLPPAHHCRCPDWTICPTMRCRLWSFPSRTPRPHPPAPAPAMPAPLPLLQPAPTSPSLLPARLQARYRRPPLSPQRVHLRMQAAKKLTRSYPQPQHQRQQQRQRRQRRRDQQQQRQQQQ